MEYWHGLILLLAGCIAGFINVVAGGGSILTVPIMVFMGMPGPVANGTNRIAILAQNITAVIAFFRKGYSNFKLSLSLALCSVPGAVAGAFIGTRLEGVWFNRVLAIIMIIVMIAMSYKSDKNHATESVSNKPRNLLWGHLLMVAIGFWGGFIQIGVGLILMPVLYRVMGLDLVQVNMHKVFIVGTYTTLALIIFAWSVEILWLMGICLAIGNSIGGWLGVHFSITKGERFIKIILNIVLVIFVIKLLFF